MKLFLFLISLAVSCLSFASDKSAAQKTIEVFDGTCIRNYNDFEGIKYLLEATGAKKIPDEVLKFDPAMRKLGGDGYVYQYENENYMIGYSQGISCGIATDNFDGSRTIELIKNNFKVKKVYEDDSGVQVTHIFMLSDNNPYSGAIIAVTYAKESTGLKVGSLGLITADAVEGLNKQNRS
ncbi:hypothetical protein [Endozoicomonas euniceicola]|uniref:DUF4252 domain-containing protein n=1 Tax=Endozoicomonas euniceicola TaxID=1234143 RepID=A0ABY6GUN4_9GAMM|nr:hypothetical protein [Endozoicomonas euniceicola]UYM16292.1 hypothetical protein NX720_26440 [Endozoicomonas euniceicola]